MPMFFLKELAQRQGEVHITNVMEIGWLIVLKSRGLVDADIEQPAASPGQPKPHLQAVLRGLTPDGWAALEQVAMQKKSSWSDFFRLKPKISALWK
ncbi:hypothetical protein [Rhodoferax sp.]|uniref:hypothetical protein n=1 Tax=Rhodoferax sp. TaxID=50421 RepID=UPI00374DA733